MGFIVSNTQVDQCKITSTNSDYSLQGTRVLEEIAKTIRLTSDLAKLALESIESKFVIEGSNLVDRGGTGFSATDEYTPCCHCGRTNHFVGSVLEEVPRADVRMEGVW
jgi:hypothetical protein